MYCIFPLEVLVQDYGNSNAFALEEPQSCTSPSIYTPWIEINATS